MTTGEAMAELTQRTKNSMEHSAQAKFVSSFDTLVPSVFAPSSSAAANMSSYVEILKKKMPSYDHWMKDKLTKNGLSFFTKEVIKDGHKQIKAVMRTDLSGDGRELCSQITDDSKDFALALVTHISEFYENIRAISALPAAEVWEICLETLAHVLQDLVSVRNFYRNSGAMNPSLYGWGMLRAWEVQQRYLANNFTGDPSMNNVLLQRVLFKRSDPKLETLEKECRKHFARIDKLEKK